MESQTFKSDPELDSSAEAGSEFRSLLFIWYAESRFGTSWISVSHDSPEETWGIEGTASLVSPQTLTETQHLTVLSSFMIDFRMEIRMSLIFEVRCRWDKNSVSSPPLEPCFDVPNNSPNHLLNSLLLCLEKLAKKSSNQTTHLFSCQNSL